MKVKMLTRWCECDLGTHRCRVNSPSDLHMDGCRWSINRAPLRVKQIRLSVSHQGRWEVSRLFMAGGFFYSGIIINVSHDFFSGSYWLGALLMVTGLGFLLSCCAR
jgi:hypothetical protein